MSLLQVTDLVVQYGNITAVHGISFGVSNGEIVTLIGANGAGKTSTLAAIMGVIEGTSGTIQFEETEIVGKEPGEVVRMGLSLVPEGRQLFTRMTVMENLDMGSYLRKDVGGVSSDIQMVFSLFPILSTRSKQLAGMLSGGEQQMLAIGRALMAKPKLLLMDEPSMGLAPILVTEIFRHIAKINQSGTTILLVEQNASQALRLANRGYVLETGRIVLDGSTEVLITDKKVREAYIGQTNL